MRGGVVPVLAGLLVLAVAGSLQVGPAGPVLFSADPQAQLVLMELRLPRTAMAVLCGGILGLAGAALQGLLRNPLADPGLLGISGAGALGGVMALYFGLSLADAGVAPLLGLAAAGGAALLLLALAGRRPPPATLILAGLAINALGGALTWLALSLAPSPFAAAEALTWILGTFEGVSMADVRLVLPFGVAAAVLLLPLGRGLDALALGEDAARSLGSDPARLRLACVAGVAAGTGAIGALVGTLSFVGLIVPHVLRPLAGARPGALLLPSALGGAIMVLGADMALRGPLEGLRLQLGVVTSLIGAPLFLWLVMRARWQERGQ